MELRRTLGRVPWAQGPAPPSKTSPKGDTTDAQKGGLTTKLMTVVNGTGRLVNFTIHPGESVEFAIVMEGLEPEEVIADRACDTNGVRQQVADVGAEAVIPPKSTRNPQIPDDAERHKERRWVENFFEEMKRFRRIAARYEKTARRFRGMVAPVAAFISLRKFIRAGENQ